MQQVAVILPAAGSSGRFLASGGTGDKLMKTVGGKAVLLRAAEAFLGRAEVVQVLVAAPPDRVDDYEAHFGEALRFQGGAIVPGGRIERWDTVKEALKHVDPLCTHIAVHDAARPMVSEALVGRVFEAAKQRPAVIPGLAVSDSLKRAGEPVQAEADVADLILGGEAGGGLTLRPVHEAVDRSGLIAVQTPQVFERDVLVEAYAKLEAGELDPAGITDDAGLVQAMGVEVVAVEGEATNLKVTRVDDLTLCEALCKTHEQAAQQDAVKRLFGDDDDD